jgi:hypothetical protein
MDQIIVKIVGGIVGALFAGAFHKSLTRQSEKRINQTSPAITGPKATDDDSEKPNKPDSGGSGTPTSAKSTQRSLPRPRFGAARATICATRTSVPP